MKKMLIPSIFAAVFIAVLSVFTFAYEAQIPAREKFAADTTYMKSENLALNGVCENKEIIDGKVDTLFRSLKKENFYITVDLGSEKTINSVILKEKGLNVKGFVISVSADGKTFANVYENDKIEYHRLCTFDAVKARYVRLTVTEADSLPAIREMEIYNEPVRSADDFRVTAYLAEGKISEILADPNLSNVQKEEQLNKYFDDYSLESLTHLFYYCGMSFDENGNIYLGDKAEDQTVKEEQARLLVKVLRERMKPEAKISFVFGFNQSHPGRNFAMKDNRDEFINNLIGFAERCGFDGIDIDYEFPQTKEDFSIFSDFLVALKDAMNSQLGEGNLLSCAFGTRDLNYTQEAIKALDMVNIMTYDIMDQDGQHASFWSCTQQAIAYAEEVGFERNRINLGIPFYGTQTDAIMEQYIYKNLPDTNYYQNTYNVNGYLDSSLTPVYFNSPAMVRDKTAFAMFNGCGIMVWSFSCDTAVTDENSLWKAVNDAVKQFGGDVNE